jgi:hypothetical protein
MTCRCLSQLSVSLKNTGPVILVLKRVAVTNFHWMELGLHGLDVDSVNSSSDYFAYLCIPSSETMLRQKRMSIADRSHLRRQTVESNCKTEIF